jgi:hypothetical protein
MLRIQKAQKITDLTPYTDILEKMWNYYEISGSVNSYFGTVADITDWFEDQGLLKETFEIFKIAYTHLRNHDVRVVRVEFVGKYVQKLVTNKEYITTMQVLRDEVEFYKKSDPDSHRINTYTVSCII